MHVSPTAREFFPELMSTLPVHSQATYIKYARDTLFAASVSHAQSQLGSADAEIKVPCVENQISEMS